MLSVYVHTLFPCGCEIPSLSDWVGAHRAASRRVFTLASSTASSPPANSFLSATLLAISFRKKYNMTRRRVIDLSIKREIFSKLPLNESGEGTRLSALCAISLSLEYFTFLLKQTTSYFCLYIIILRLRNRKFFSIANIFLPLVIFIMEEKIDLLRLLSKMQGKF